MDRNRKNKSNSLQFIMLTILIVWCIVIYSVYSRFSANKNEDYNHSYNNVNNDDNRNNNVKNRGLFWGNLSTNIDDIIKNVPSQYREFCSSLLSDKNEIRQNQVWSQAFQEWYIYHNFFEGKIDGMYIDIGAHKPLSLSNSAFFDICLQWKGICVEPSSTSEEFASVRSCTIAKHCAWSEMKKLIMIFRSQGDASLIIDEKEQNRIKIEKPDRLKDFFECNAIDGFNLFQLYKPKDRFGNIVDISYKNIETGIEANVNGNANKQIEIDFISLDVEGAEVEFLKCFPFDKYDVKVWAIEINKHSVAIDEILLANGFMKYEQLTFFGNPLDGIYVKKPQNVLLPWKTKDTLNKWRKYPRCDGNVFLPYEGK